MKTIDLRVKHIRKILKIILKFLETRLNISHNLICKEIAFQIFDRFEKISKLRKEFKEKAFIENYSFHPNLNSIQVDLEQSYLDQELLEDLVSTLENSWGYLENKFCKEIDITDWKKEVTIKLKCQVHSNFSNDREDVAVLCLLLFEEFCRFVDNLILICKLVFIDKKVTEELKNARDFDVKKGFKKFFDQEVGFALITDFYQKLNRYLSNLNDNFESNLKNVRNFKVIAHVSEQPLLLISSSEKHSVYKEFVQSKIHGLLSFIQQKKDESHKEQIEGLNSITNDFLSHIVDELSTQQFEDHFKKLKMFGKV